MWYVETYEISMCLDTFRGKTGLTLTFWPLWKIPWLRSNVPEIDGVFGDLDLLQWCAMRRIAYMHGYVFSAANMNIRPLGFSLLAGWKCGNVFLFVSVDNSMTSFERSRKEENNYMKPVQTGSVPRHVSKSAPQSSVVNRVSWQSSSFMSF